MEIRALVFLARDLVVAPQDEYVELHRALAPPPLTVIGTSLAASLAHRYGLGVPPVGRPQSLGDARFAIDLDLLA